MLQTTSLVFDSGMILAIDWSAVNAYGPATPTVGCKT